MSVCVCSVRVLDGVFVFVCVCVCVCVCVWSVFDSVCFLCTHVRVRKAHSQDTYNIPENVLIGYFPSAGQVSACHACLKKELITQRKAT